MPQYRKIPPSSVCYSEISSPGQKVLCISIPEMVKCDLPRITLKVGCKRHRTGEVYCWPHHKEGREVFIHYDGIQEKYQRLIDTVLCGGVQADLFVRNQEALARENQLNRFKNMLPGMVDICSADVSELSKMKLFIPNDVQRIARTAGWLRLWRKMDVKTARKIGFESVKEVQSEMFKCCLNEQTKRMIRFPKPINNERTLNRKACEFEKDGIRVLVGGYFGNANREKMNGDSHKILMTLAGNPVKYSFEDIAMIYNTEAKERKLPQLTVSTIRKHLNQPKHHQIWYYSRHGQYAGNQNVQPYIDRAPVSKPDMLWSLDGTTMQLYYRKEVKPGKWEIKSDLYAYFVTDACTGAIIGYSVAFQETSGMVVEALRNALDTYGYIPFQMNFDNSSANISTTVTALINNMTHISFPCQPESGRSKSVELVIGHFQQRELRKLENFKGGNVTVRNLNSKANPDLLKVLSKDIKRLPDESTVLEQFKESIQSWNNRGEKRDSYGLFVGKSKIERYTEIFEGRTQLNYFEKLSLFMVEMKNPQDINGEYKYGQKGIEISIRGKKKKFIVPDNDSSAMDFDFSRENLGRTFKVSVNLNQEEATWIKLCDREGMHVADAYEKEQLAACVADIKSNPGEMAKIQLAVRKQKECYTNAMSEMERQRVTIISMETMKATGTDGFGWWDTPKHIENARQSAQEDKQNGFTPQTEDEIRSAALMNLLNR